MGQSRNEDALENILGAENELLPPMSRNEKILHAILGEQIDLEEPQSRIEDLLIRIYEHGMGAEIIPLSVTENGTYTADEGKAYSPVTVDVAAVSKLPQVVDKSVTEITANDLAGATSIGSNAFAACVGLTKITIPNSVTSIGSNAFAACVGLTKITIPNGVTSIQVYAFFNCSRLTEITCLAENPPTIYPTTFNNVPTDCAIYVPTESVEAYKTAQYWSDRADYIQEIPA